MPKLNIKYIINARIPTEKAHGYQICKMCGEFAGLGIKVDLWLPTRKNQIKEDLFSFYGLKRNFTVKYINSPDFIVYDKIIGRWGCYLQQIFYLLILFFKKIKKGTIVYSRNSEIAWLFGIKGHKSIYEAHSFSDRQVKLLKIFVKKISYIITVTNNIKKEIINLKYSSKKILLTHDGVDLGIFDIKLDKQKARERLDLPDDKIILGYTGSFKTMGKDKGISDSLKVLRILNKVEHKYLFVAVGGTKKDIDYYKNKAFKLGVEKSAVFINKVKQKKLAVYQKAFDIMLMPFPNIEHYANNMSPLKMFEYMASKRPIISSDLPSVRDVLNEGNCFFCEPDNTEDLAAKIIQLINNNELANKIADKAYEDAGQYSWRIRAKKIIKFIS